MTETDVEKDREKKKKERGFKNINVKFIFSHVIHLCHTTHQILETK